MRGLVTCLFFAITTPAFADTTAVYAAPSGATTMTIEIADNGDVRADFPGRPDVYSLTRNGQVYIVITTSKGPVVDRVEDLGPALEVVIEKRGSPDFKASMKGLRSNLATMPFRLVPGDDIIVRGRKGTPYYIGRGGPITPDHISGTLLSSVPPPILVIGNEPELAPLGVVIAHQNELSDSVTPWSAGNPFSQQIEAILRKGTPLKINGGELTTVSHDPIPPSQFDLPAPPESRDDVIKRIDSTATSQSVTAF